MARLVAVCRSEDYPFERRQIPLIVDDNLTVIILYGIIFITAYTVCL